MRCSTAGVNNSRYMGQWQGDLHINILEIRNVLLVIHAFQVCPVNHMVALMRNNAVEEAYVNKQGKMVSLSPCLLVKQL